jgi:hypothetical protein
MDAKGLCCKHAAKHISKHRIKSKEIELEITIGIHFVGQKQSFQDLKSIEVDNMRFMKLQIQVQIVPPDIEMEATLVSWGNMTLEPSWLQSVSMPRQDENDRSLIRSLQPILSITKHPR